MGGKLQSWGNLKVPSELYSEGDGDIRSNKNLRGNKNHDASQEFNKDGEKKKEEEEKKLFVVKGCETQFRLRHLCAETCQVTEAAGSPRPYICKMGVAISPSHVPTAEDSKS